MTRVAVATTSQLAADAAAEVADGGGNAVDCAIAASLIAMNTEPGVCALSGGAYITIWHPDQDPVTIDGNVAVPGRGLEKAPAAGVELVHMEYGGGIETLVGAGAVAVPGSLAAIAAASESFGDTAWASLFAPSIRAAKSGFPLSSACHYYLEYSGDVVFGRSKDGHDALHDDGKLVPARSNIVVPHLADSLDAIATGGSGVFYEGEIGQAIAQHCFDHGGRLTMDDLGSYRPEFREPLIADLAGWRVANNPPPAIGGAVLSAMLLAFARHPVSTWDHKALQQLIDIQRNVLSYRKNRLDLADDVAKEVAQLITMAGSADYLSKWASSSTVHTSAVDDTGLACAITASSGYGSGEMPAGTGLWLNNALGELELNRRGLDAGPPGSRLPSNMAPGVARSAGRVLAIGSPGADRITTALHQFLVNFIQMDLSLHNAIAEPRLHLELGGESETLAVEPGIDLPPLDLSIRRYPEIGMYFGGVAAALFDQKLGFDVAADPRREGGTCISGD